MFPLFQGTGSEGEHIESPGRGLAPERGVTRSRFCRRFRFVPPAPTGPVRSGNVVPQGGAPLGILCHAVASSDLTVPDVADLRGEDGHPADGPEFHAASRAEPPGQAAPVGNLSRVAVSVRPGFFRDRLRGVQRPVVLTGLCLSWDPFPGGGGWELRTPRRPGECFFWGTGEFLEGEQNGKIHSRA